MYRFLFIVMFFLPIGNVWAKQTPFARGMLTTPSSANKNQPYSYPRQSPKQKMREKIFDLNRDQWGKVYDPTGQEIKFNDPWDAGHKPEYPFAKDRQRAMKEGWSPERWRQDQRDPVKYRPELPSTNRSHKFEHVPKNTLKSAARATKMARSMTTIRQTTRITRGIHIAGGVVSIVFGSWEIGSGIVEWREIDRQFYAGEWDTDIMRVKKILAGGRVVLGTLEVASGILLLLPEPVITKIIAEGLIVTVVVGYIILEVVNYALGRVQAKRVEARQKIQARFQWQERWQFGNCQLREQIQKI